jgi:glycosyltransferase involved in cell wall biosynthesis
MRLLFVHQNLPAQFRHLLGTLAGLPGVEVVGIRQGDTPAVGWPERFPLLRYASPQPGSAQTHHYLRGFEGQLRRGQTIARVCLDLKRKGFIPDRIIAHPGWGETLFIKDVFPQSHLLSFFEFFYQAEGGDVGFDPEFPPDFETPFRLRIKNTHLLHDLVLCDEALAPTEWQASQAPEIFRPKIRVMHDGIRTDICTPDSSAEFVLPDGRKLSRKNKVLTYVARNLEPYRGFHVFMRALPGILAADREVQVVIVGGDEVSYGAAVQPPFSSYREMMMAEVGAGLDMGRVHFVGRQPYGSYLRLLQISSLHVYLTYPFVLSWSLLEAMSVGCRILASDTPPVREMITDGVEGVLTDFHDVAALSARVLDLLAKPDEGLGVVARRKVVETLDYETVIRGRWLQYLGL